MRWFASYWLTVVICFIGAGLYWVGQQELGPLDEWVDWLMPGGFPPWWTIPALVSGCYTLVRLLLHRVLAYTESAIDASPRAEDMRGRRRAAIGNAAYTAFNNPSGWWLAPFATTLALASGFASVVRWSVNALDGWRPDGGDFFINLLLMLAILYSLTVASAMLFPDRPQPLNVATELEPDPVLAIPDDRIAAERAQRRLFGRTKAKRSGKGAGAPAANI